MRSAIANNRKPTAPRQNPTGSSRNARWENAVNVPTVKASAASPINNQQTFRMVRIIDGWRQRRPPSDVAQPSGAARDVVQPFRAAINLDELLDHTIGKRITLSVSSSPSGQAREVTVKPTDQ
jgi:hypothetical protein